MESLYTALRNIDRADIVTSLESQAPQPAPGSEEGACRLSDRDSTLLSPSVINGKTHRHIKHHRDRKKNVLWSPTGDLILYFYIVTLNLTNTEVRSCHSFLQQVINPFVLRLERLPHLTYITKMPKDLIDIETMMLSLSDSPMMICNDQKWKVYRNFLLKQNSEGKSEAQ